MIQVEIEPKLKLSRGKPGFNSPRTEMKGINKGKSEGSKLLDLRSFKGTTRTRRYA